MGVVGGAARNTRVFKVFFSLFGQFWDGLWLLVSHLKRCKKNVAMEFIARIFQKNQIFLRILTSFETGFFASKIMNQYF